MASPTTYLDLCRRLVRDMGINGGVFTSVVSTNPEEVKVADWVREADLQVQNIWFDWDFLWRSASGLLTQGSDALPRDPDLGYLKTDSVVIGKGTNTFSTPNYLPYLEFFDLYEKGVKQSSDTPGDFAETPDHAAAFKLSANIASVGVPYYYEFWREPVPLVADAQVPLIGPFDRYSQRIIYARAKMIYADSENAPEIMSTAAAEYEDLLMRLEAASHDESKKREHMLTRRRDDDMALVVTTR